MNNLMKLVGPPTTQIDKREAGGTHRLVTHGLSLPLSPGEDIFINGPEDGKFSLIGGLADIIGLELGDNNLGDVHDPRDPSRELFDAQAVRLAMREHVLRTPIPAAILDAETTQAGREVVAARVIEAAIRQEHQTRVQAVAQNAAEIAVPPDKELQLVSL